MLGRHCLDRRTLKVETLRRKVAAWEQMRNDLRTAVTWHVTTEHARTKLQRIYPS